jgi:hypothetical protein
MQGEDGLTIPSGSALLAIRGRAEVAVPLVAELQQNHPNPFNPVTTITFSVPGEAGSTRMLQDVSLEVFDLLGRRVATLVNDTRTPGVYTTTFDASKLSSGTYLYRLTAGSFTAVRRMMLVK